MQMEKNNPVEQGALVIMPNKSGRYIGELLEISGPRGLVKVLAVLKHPEQGDLHQPYDPDVALFHERRALSYTEKAWAMLQELEPYKGEVPDYAVSLKQALQREIVMCDKLKRWAERALEQLERLEREYK
ncbi:sporulation phosphorelay system protein KapB [Paenibacillus tarimensis]